MKLRKLDVLAAVLTLIIAAVIPAAAVGKTEYTIPAKPMRVKTDSGYDMDTAKDIGGKDPHFGWQLGEFILSGVTDRIDDGGKLVYLITPGDTIELSFKLKQKYISKLNDNDSLRISYDGNGWSKGFGVPKTNFGRGTLITRYTDPFGKTEDPVVYTDYLSGIVTGKADTKISSLKEGDYEIALFYEIDESYGPFGKMHRYYNYVMTAEFGIRSGTTTNFLMDIDTKTQLADKSVVQNGFEINVAKSASLKISVNYSELTNNGSTYAMTTQKIAVSSDGRTYTNPGLYTIESTNAYTGKTVVQQVCVIGDSGLDDIMHAWGKNGGKMSLDEIATKQNNGDISIGKNWNILPYGENDSFGTKVGKVIDKTGETIDSGVNTVASKVGLNLSPEERKEVTIISVIIVIGLAVAVPLAVKHHKRKSLKPSTVNETDNNSAEERTEEKAEEKSEEGSKEAKQ